MSDQRKDPRKEGWIFTWAVIRENSSLFVTAFPTKDAAEARASTLETGYKVTYVTHLPGTDEYIIEDELRD